MGGVTKRRRLYQFDYDWTLQKDGTAVHLASVEGALKVYETKAKSEFYDGLLEKRNKSELRAFVEEATNTKCKSKT